MAKHIKNIELFYQNKIQPIAHQRKRPDQYHNRLQELNFWKMFIKMPRPNSYSKQSEVKLQPPLYNEQQRLIVISSFKNTQTTNESPKKITKNNKDLMRRYISDEDLNIVKRMTHKSQLNIVEQRGRNSNRQETVISNDMSSIPSGEQESVDQNRSEVTLMSKRTVVSGNQSEIKTKFRINRQYYRKPMNMINKVNSKIKLPQLKEEKKFPVLMKDSQQLKDIKSDSFIIVEYPTERIIVAHRSAISLQIASLTKIMTFYTISKIIQQQQTDIKQQKITVSPKVIQISGTSADLIEGQQYTIEQMLYGLMLPSGNDAANQLAYWGGSFYCNSGQTKTRQKAFIGEMNRYAKILELKNTKFANPHGLPHQQAKSTAADVAKLCCICMKIELFQTIVNCKMFKTTVKSGNATRQVIWQNTNKLLRRQGFIGLKTGITVTAGPCLAAAYTFRNKIYISVILRAPKVSGRFKQTRLLLHWALAKLYKDVNDVQKLMLKKLRRHDHDLDSDNSQDEHEFKYDKNGLCEFKKRCNILNYQI